MEKIKEEKPERLIDPKHVCYWYEKTGELLGSMKSKARQFLEFGCVMETENQNIFVVKHIEGYNKTNHQIDIITEKCTCQASRKNNIRCSHIQAVRLYLFKRKWNENSTRN